MASFTTIAAVTTLAFLSACASPGAPATKADEHASHHPDAKTTAPGASMPAMQERMKAMREMHDKMMNAKTPAERQALMADHMKSMQDGMAMMKGMGSMEGMAMGSGMGDGKAMPAEMAKRHQMMEERMKMMQMMMEMMMQRLPNPPSTK